MNKSIFFLANQAAMLLDCFAFLCNLIPLLLNLKYTAKQEKIKCVLFSVVNHRKELITLPYWLVQLNIFYSS
jgi:hypothetical protein